MSTQPPESKKPMDQTESEKPRRDFYEEEDAFVESAEHVLSDYRELKERDVDRSKILEEFNEKLSTVDLEHVRGLSSRLIEVSDELQKLKSLIGRDEEKANRYAQVVDGLIKAGTNDLDTLVNELNESGYLRYVESLASRGLLTNLQLSYEDLPLSERKLIEQFYLSQEQTEILWRIVTSYVRGRITRYDNDEYDLEGGLVPAVLNQNIEFLRWYSSPESAEDSHRRQRRVLVLNGVGQIFCGTGLIGLNVAGFMATMGLVLNLENTLMSSITGGAIVLGGAKDVDLARYLEKTTKTPTQKTSQPNPDLIC